MSSKPFRIPTYGTLKEVGFERGDFLPLYTFNPNGSHYANTTSTTYTNLLDLSRIHLIWDEMFPSGVTTQVFGQVRIEPGTDETAYARVRNASDDETIGSPVSATGVSVRTVGPLDYTPPSDSSRIMILWQFRTDPGSNSSTYVTPYITFGVKV